MKISDDRRFVYSWLIENDLLWFQRCHVTQMQRVLWIGVLHFGPKRLSFWAKTFCVLGQNDFHFAAKRVPFCGKMHPILRQNAFYFAAKCILFCGKMHFILRQNASRTSET